MQYELISILSTQISYVFIYIVNIITYATYITLSMLSLVFIVFSSILTGEMIVNPSLLIIVFLYFTFVQGINSNNTI